VPLLGLRFVAQDLQEERLGRRRRCDRKLIEEETPASFVDGERLASVCPRP